MSIKFLRIGETCIYARDLEAIRVFYEQVLELPVINYLPGKHIFFRVGQTVLLFFNPDDSSLKESPPAHYGGGKQHFAFEVADDDYVSIKHKLTDKGIVITDEITWKGGKKSFYFEDPVGNVLEVIPDKGIWS